MKYFIPTLFLSFFAIKSYSQNKGIIYYGQISSVSLKGPYGPDFNSYLVFDDKVSYYVTEKDSLDANTKFKRVYYNEDANIGYGRSIYTRPLGNQVYFNREKDSVYWNQWSSFYVAEKTPKINWKLETETKKIGTFTVHKATSKFRGRTYTAWYTPKIPLPYGPWKLQGLPGLILEAYDTDKEMFLYFKSLEYPVANNVIVSQIKKPKDVTWKTLKDFKDRIEKIYERMLNSNITIAQKMNTNIPEEKIKSEALLESF